MATRAVIPEAQTAEYEKYREWILHFIQSEYGKDLREVQIVIAKDFELGGGGLYMKSNEGLANLMMAKQRTGKSAEELKGKFVVVKAENFWMKAEYKLKTCWIIWHEFGHALGEKNRAGYGVGEAQAYKFELKAVKKAVQDNTLHNWGHDKASILKFLEERETTYKSMAPTENSTIINEVRPAAEELKGLLKAQTGSLQPSATVQT